MGCPTTQKVSQKMTLPMLEPGIFFHRYFVVATSGTCINIPMKDQGLIM